MRRLRVGAGAKSSRRISFVHSRCAQHSASKPCGTQHSPVDLAMREKRQRSTTRYTEPGKPSDLSPNSDNLLRADSLIQTFHSRCPRCLRVSTSSRSQGQGYVAARAGSELLCQRLCKIMIPIPTCIGCSKWCDHGHSANPPWTLLFPRKPR